MYQSIKYIFKKVIWYSYCVFILGNVSLNLGSGIFSEKIKNQSQLEGILKEEMSILGIKDKKVSARFGKAILGSAHCRKLSDNNYEIVLDKGRKRSILKYELYHIYKNHLDFLNINEDSILESMGKIVIKPFKDYFVDEPQAILYESLGIKL